MGRPRPAVHLTADHGWLNDPYGVHWDGERYHLFFQTVPDSLTWQARCEWGHAVSDDLVDWQLQAPALRPHGDETGCWSGSVVARPGEPPVLVYTSVALPLLGQGRIAVARPDGDHWRSTSADVVVPGPPPTLDLAEFRDPYLLRHDDRWRMVVGGGTRDGRPVLTSYSSDGDDAADATEGADVPESWSYDGVLATAEGPGAAWECPQLLPVDGRWVLVVSVWERGRTSHVVARPGDYDGTVFTPAADWQQLSHGVPYATSAFADRDGTPCVISWLRENEAAEPEDFAGALSVVSTVALDGDRVVLSPHPALGNHVDDVTLAPGAERRCGPVVLSHDGTQLRVGDQPTGLTLPPASARVQVLLDADLLEVWAAEGGYGAWRIPLSG